MKVPTIKVRRLEDDVECIINASDFDTALHEELRIKKEAEDAPKKAPAKKKAES